MTWSYPYLELSLRLNLLHFIICKLSGGCLECVLGHANLCQELDGNACLLKPWTSAESAHVTLRNHIHLLEMLICNYCHVLSLWAWGQYMSLSPCYSSNHFAGVMILYPWSGLLCAVHLRLLSYLLSYDMCMSDTGRSERVGPCMLSYIAV